MRAEYKQIRGHNNVSGRNRKITRFLPQLDAILGNRPSTEPRSVIDSGVDDSAQVEEGCSSNNSVLEEEESEGACCTSVRVFYVTYDLLQKQVRLVQSHVNLLHIQHKTKQPLHWLLHILQFLPLCEP